MREMARPAKPMSKRYDLVVLGAGTAGIVASTYAAQAGARVALIERERIGGDCLHTGCVPSKALLASAERAHALRTAGRFGIGAVEPNVDFAAVMAHVRGAIEQAGAEDTPEHLRSEGVDVVEDAGRFTGPGQIEAGGRRLSFRAAIIATGSKPAMPPIPGLDAVEPLTNESLFELDRLPARLAVIGGGPIGCEMAQAFRRLGAEVRLIEAAPSLLPREEPEAGALVAEVLGEEGVEVHTATAVTRVDPAGGSNGGDLGAGAIELEDGGSHPFDRVLVATGRRGVVDGLGLDRVGVEVDEQGFVGVDDGLRTSGDRIFAAGDVAGDLQFTHFAAYQSMIAMANGLFRARQKVERHWVPWATFTDPEVAHAGMTESAARAVHGDAVEVYTHDYADNDRAITAGNARGFAKLVAGKRGRLLGATIAGPAAGESIIEAARLIRDGDTVADLSQMIHVYPTYTEGPSRAANELWTRKYLTPRNRRLLRPLHAVLRTVDRPRG